jgi:hypothetical protein
LSKVLDVCDEEKFWNSIEGFATLRDLRQPIFNNPLILNTIGFPLGGCGFSEGRAIANSGCTRIKDLWDLKSRAWKSL